MRAFLARKVTAKGDRMSTRASNPQRNVHHALPGTLWNRRIRHCRELSDAMKFNGRSFLFVAFGCGLMLFPASRIHAQKPDSDAPAATQGQEPDPLKRERSDQDKFKANKELKQEIRTAYKSWLEQDVAYIITDEERKAFKNL